MSSFVGAVLQTLALLHYDQKGVVTDQSGPKSGNIYIKHYKLKINLLRNTQPYIMIKMTAKVQDSFAVSPSDDTWIYA